MQDLGLPMEQCVTSEMFKECKFAQSRCQIHMEEKMKESVETEIEKKRKAIGEELN